MTVDLVRIAASAFDEKEIVGSLHNTAIVGWLSHLGFGVIDDDETPWCSAFMNWCAMVAGLERPNHLSARSWLEVGEPVEHPQYGDIVVFWRESPDSTKGHVALVFRETLDSIYALGGNQNNKVCIKEYPKDRVLGYRRLA